MSTKFIFLTGKKFSGKSTVANYIKTKYKNTVEVAFADPLKKICQELFLLDDNQLYNQDFKEKIDSRWNVSPRDLFQNIGDMFRNNLQKLLPNIKLEHGLVFTENIHYRVLQLLNSSTPPDVIIFSDGRLEDEHNYFKQNYKDGISIRIVRPNINNYDSHISENGTFKTDITIINDNTLTNLFKQIDTILYQ